MAASRVITPPEEAMSLVSKDTGLASARGAGRKGTNKRAGQGAGTCLEGHRTILFPEDGERSCALCAIPFDFHHVVGDILNILQVRRSLEEDGDPHRRACIRGLAAAEVEGVDPRLHVERSSPLKHLLRKPQNTTKICQRPLFLTLLALRDGREWQVGPIRRPPRIALARTRPKSSMERLNATDVHFS
jgi:hypothetical protein